MRTLLFTVLGVIVAATAGVSYLALSPAPERPSDSLKLVIETGSIPSTRTATDAAKGDVPTGALGASETASGEAGNEPSLDEVIAARLRQAADSEPAQDTSLPEDATRQDKRKSAAAPSATSTIPQIVDNSAPADSAANNESAPDGSTVRAASTADATTSSGSGGEVSNTRNTPEAPPGTVSITQMLAAELNKDDGDSAEPADSSTGQAAGEPAGLENGTAPASGGERTAPSSLDTMKTAARLQQGTPATPPEDEPATAAPAQTVAPSASSGQSDETTVAALDPQLDAQPDTQAADTAGAAVSEEQPPSAPRNATRQQPDEQPTAQPEPLASADAPALPRQRGAFQVRGRIALIIRGLGVKADLTEQAIAGMPQQVAMAFVPYGDDLKSGTQRARQDRHDILLQIPLEPKGYPDKNPGPHTLLTSLSIDENLEHLDWLLDRFDGITGVTNYLGGKFAESPGAFAPLMMELKARDLLYVDDSKAANTTTRQIARQVSLAYSVADIVIDAKRQPDAIQQKLSELETQARQNGSAIAIGHAHAATLEALQGWMRSLNDKGLALVPITELTTPPAPRVSQSTGG